MTQLDKDDVEAAGLVKFDFLGLRTLTIIDWALELIRETRGDAPVIERIPMDDPEVLQLLCRGDTTAVFQLESRGMKELIRRLKAKFFLKISWHWWRYSGLVHCSRAWLMTLLTESMVAPRLNIRIQT